MHTRSTSVLALTAVIAFAPVTAAFAQDSGARRNNGQQIGAQRHATPGRLIVPVTGTLGTEAPPVEPPPVEPPAPPTLTPATPAPVAPAADGEPDVTGTFSIQRFARTVEDGVAAVGTLTLSFSDPGTSTARTVVTQLALPVAASSETPQPTPNPGEQPPARSSRPAAAAAATPGCGTVGLVLGARTLDLTEQSVQLGEARIDLTAVEGTSERLGTLLCQVSDLMGNNASGRAADLVQALNALLDTVG